MPIRELLAGETKNFLFNELLNNKTNVCKQISSLYSNQQASWSVTFTGVYPVTLHERFISYANNYHIGLYPFTLLPEIPVKAKAEFADSENFPFFEEL